MKYTQYERWWWWIRQKEQEEEEDARMNIKKNVEDESEIMDEIVHLIWYEQISVQ